MTTSWGGTSLPDPTNITLSEDHVGAQYLTADGAMNSFVAEGNGRSGCLGIEHDARYARHLLGDDFRHDFKRLLAGLERNGLTQFVRLAIKHDRHVGFTVNDVAGDVGEERIGLRGFVG